MTQFICYQEQEVLPIDLKYEIFGNLEQIPSKIFYKGDLNKLIGIKIGIIGSRNAEIDSIKITKIISKELSSAGFIIVSGLARGIDSTAHLSAGENTIGILGHGFQEIYPKENYILAKNISKFGLILTEYGYGTPIAKFRFVARNRLIAALSKILIVIQVKENSGSLITCCEAIKLGIPIFIWISSTKISEAERMLLAWGAIPFSNIQELIANIRSFKLF